MHTIKTLEIRTDGEAVTVSSTVTGLGVAEGLCEEIVNRVTIEDTSVVEEEVEGGEVEEEVAEEIRRTWVDVPTEEDETGCIKVVVIVGDGTEDEVGARLEVVEVASRK